MHADGFSAVKGEVQSVGEAGVCDHQRRTRIQGSSAVTTLANSSPKKTMIAFQG